MSLAVMGYGVVGQHMAQDIERAGHKAVIYDPPLNKHDNRDEVNACRAAFVCVPTPEANDGSCDTSIIDSLYVWLNVTCVILRSTVPPGSTARWQAQRPDMLSAVVPEFYGEGVNHPYTTVRQPPFLIIGGNNLARFEAGQILSTIYNSECEFIYTDSTTAEAAKLAENYFLALKVTWANELYDICERVGSDFGAMMAAVTHDPRIGRSHTHVYRDRRGFDGRCLPKDTASLLHVAGADAAPLLAAMRAINARRRK